MTADENPKNSCPGCGKAYTQRRGSLTAWIFGGNVCTCGGELSREAEEAEEVPDCDERLSDQYELLKLIGEGGMSSVYRAYDRIRHRECAVKLISRELMKQQSFLNRFRREALASLTLDHPNIVHTYEQGISDGRPCLVFEYVDGQTLAQRFAAEELTRKEILQLMVQVCQGMSYAHKQKIIHRDLKPSNLLIASENGADVVKIADFGIARVQNTFDTNSQSLTQTGDVFGSPLYMSPEQCRGEAADARSDIYSLGCILYEGLSGHPPFEGSNVIKTILGHLNERPRTIPGLDATGLAVMAISLHALEKLPDYRYQSMDELKSDMELVLRNIRTGRTDFDHMIAQRPITRIVDSADLQDSSALPTNRAVLPSLLALAFVALCVATVCLVNNRLHSSPADATTTAPSPPAAVAESSKPAAMPHDADSDNSAHTAAQHTSPAKSTNGRLTSTTPIREIRRSASWHHPIDSTKHAGTHEAGPPEPKRQSSPVWNELDKLRMYK